MSLLRSTPVTPADAGWQYCGLDVVNLAAGQEQTLDTGGAEFFVLPLAGSVRVTVAGPSGELEESFDLAGRTSVFASVTDFAYVGRDSRVTLTSLRETGAEVALPSARCERRLPARYAPAEQVPVEVRGAGAASRRVVNFGTPGVWEHAEKLICCELITPPGNWSSYPPHKHDATAGCTVVNEEIYYYRVAGADQVTPSDQGFAVHRTYTGDEHLAAGFDALDETLVVSDGDVVLVPYGYHGPCIAAPGYPMYYLNVMAGPGAQRSMAFCDDPEHAWIRDSWSAQAVDPRLAPRAEERA
ncbi:5-deoxyglucuronate isomerase [Frankineae bacterium MT45]|nr:5-deoxyglucuronate isomerase [Frankineae bacterium MT45]